MRIIFKSRQIKGDGVGSAKVFPTINLKIPEQNFSLPNGVYAAFCTIAETKYKAALHFGPRPTFDKKINSLELYILSEKLQPYDTNQEIWVEAVERIRPIMTFGSPSDLKKQIGEDILKINEILDKKPL